MQTKKIDINSGILIIYITLFVLLNISLAIVYFLSPEAFDNVTFMSMVNLLYYLVLFYIMVRFARTYLFKKEWPRFLKRKGFSIGILVGGFFLMIGVNTIVGTLFEHFSVNDTSENQEALLDLIRSGAWYNIAALALFAIILAPVVEELVFRKALYGIVKHKLGVVLAIVVSSLLFGFIHILHEPSNFIQMIPYVVMGVVLAVIYYLAKERIWVPIFAHIIWNAFTVMIMLFLPQDSSDIISFIQSIF